MYICVVCNQFYPSMGEVKACNHKPKALKVEAIDNPPPKTPSKDEEKFNKMIPNLEKMNEKGLKFMAEYLKIEFGEIEATRAKIKEAVEAK